MHKSKKLIQKVAQEYVQELLRRFPGIEAEILFESVGGSDAYIEITLPPRLANLDLEVLHATSELNYRYWEETGVNLIATVGVKEAVSNG